MNARKSFLLSVVVPVFDEEENLEELYGRLKDVLKKYRCEIIMINDGSSDASSDIIRRIIRKDPRVTLIDLTRNFGHESATTAGVEYATGDAVVVIDADLQDPPELIPKMVDLWQKGYAVVYAEREKREGESLLKRFTSAIFYKILSRLSDVPIPKNTGDFRLMDRRVVADYNKLGEKNRFFRGLVSWVGYSQTGIGYERKKRHGGTTKYNYFKLLRLSLDSITSFSTKPLFYITIMGFLIFFLSVILGIVFIYIKLVYKFPVEGWTSLIVIILFINGFQIFLLGIVGEYLSRMFIEVKGRPLYLVKEIVSGRKRNR